MRLSEVKEIYAMVQEDLFYKNWTVKQNVNDFIQFIESREDIKRYWNRLNREAFPFCLDELYLEYIEYEGFIEEEEIEIILPLDMKENEMLNREYLRSVAL